MAENLSWVNGGHAEPQFPADLRDPVPPELRATYFADPQGGESYIYEDDGYAQFHVNNSGTVMIITYNSPEVPIHILDWIAGRARHLKEGAL